MERHPTAGQSSNLHPRYRVPLQVMWILSRDIYRVADLNQDSGRIIFTTTHVSYLMIVNLLENSTESEGNCGKNKRGMTAKHQKN